MTPAPRSTRTDPHMPNTTPVRAYHCGGNNELYVAVGRNIAARMADLMAPTLSARRTADDGGPANARSQIHTIFSAMLTIMLGSQSASWARFIVREQMEPTPAFDELYNGPMGQIGRAHV